MEDIEKIIGYEFKDKKLLKVALTHSSFAHKFGKHNNERLEFLGDSILGFIVADFLLKNFEDNEGVLTKMRSSLVSCDFLSKIITKNNLHEYILASPESLKNGDNVKGDFFEALLGAIYLDSDIEVCKNFVYRILNLNLKTAKSVFNSSKDFKTLLQEKVQAEKKTMEYKLLNVSGEENAKVFEMELVIDGEVISSAKASSKQKAENQAAKIAIEKFDKNNI